MAKLSELRDLVTKARAGAPTPEPAVSAHVPRKRPAGAGKPPATSSTAAAGADAAAAAAAAATTAAADARVVTGAKAARRQLAATKHADGDVDLAIAFSDVERLPASRKVVHARPRPVPLPQQRIADAEAALAASKYGTDPAPRHWEIGQELEAEQTFVRRGLPGDVLTKLRRGHWSVQDEFDLHRMTTTEARDALADFLFAARQRGTRCVRVIHGKGLTSPGKEPVLKGKVRKWLAQWDDVLAYCEAPPHAGGGGAVLVLLRGK